MTSPLFIAGLLRLSDELNIITRKLGLKSRVKEKEKKEKGVENKIQVFLLNCLDLSLSCSIWIIESVEKRTAQQEQSRKFARFGSDTVDSSMPFAHIWLLRTHTTQILHH